MPLRKFYVPLLQCLCSRSNNFHASRVLGANGIPTLTSNAVNVLQGVVQIAHSKEVRAHIAVGGRAGSQYFSTAFGSQDNRTQFIQAMENIVFNYSLQGVHIA